MAKIEMETPTEANLNDLWSERALAERLDLEIKETGNCPKLSAMVGKGLPYIKVEGKRYFYEGHVVNYLLSKLTQK